MEHEKKLNKYFALDDLTTDTKPGLNAALYSLSELGLWHDSVDFVSEEQAIMCWKIIEKLKKEEFPNELCM
jgi:hypothetical protein